MTPGGFGIGSADASATVPADCGRLPFVALLRSDLSL